MPFEIRIQSTNSTSILRAGEFLNLNFVLPDVDFLKFFQNPFKIRCFDTHLYVCITNELFGRTFWHSCCRFGRPHCNPPAFVAWSYYPALKQSPLINHSISCISTRSRGKGVLPHHVKMNKKLTLCEFLRKYQIQNELNVIWKLVSFLTVFAPTRSQVVEISNKTRIFS